MIAEAYARLDAAYAREEVDGVIASLGAGAVVIDERNGRHSVAEVRAALIRIWRRPENIAKTTRRRSTTISAIDVRGDAATVRGQVDIELAMVGELGTKSEGHDVATFEDRWAVTPEGWRIIEDRILSTSRTQTASPSRQLETATAIIRQNTANMIDLDASVNYGDCMIRPDMQRFNYEDRQQRCRR